MKDQSLISSLLGERNSFVLIGLTGRTGSGCTTTADLLKKELQIPLVDEVNYKGDKYFKNMDRKRYGIVREYAVNNNDAFKVIKVSELISARVLALGVNEFSEFIKSVVDKELHQKVDQALENINFSSMRDSFNSFEREVNYFLNGTTSKEHNLECLNLNAWFNVVIDFTKKLKEVLKSELGNSYVQIYQSVGDSIRRTSKILPNYRSELFEPNGLFVLPRMINRIVKYYRFIDKTSNSKTYLAIDSIRNPYEAKYFKDRYAAFYLVSINAPTHDRKNIYKKNINLHWNK